MRHHPLLALGLALALVGCSSSTDNKVEVVEGTATPTTVATTLPDPGSTLDLGEPTLTEGVDVTTAGIGDVRFGMTLDEAQEAAGTELVRQDGGSDACYIAMPREAPAGVSFLVADGTVERVDVVEAGVTTPSGAGVGMSETELVDLFPDRLDVAQVDGGKRFTFVPTDPGEAEFRIIFDTDGTTVTAYRSGRLPQVESDDC